MSSCISPGAEFSRRFRARRRKETYNSFELTSVTGACVCVPFPLTHITVGALLVEDLFGERGVKGLLDRKPGDLEKSVIMIQKMLCGIDLTLQRLESH